MEVPKLSFLTLLQLPRLGNIKRKKKTAVMQKPHRRNNVSLPLNFQSNVPIIDKAASA